MSFRAVSSTASGAVGGITPVRPLVGAGTSTTAFGGSSMAVAGGSFDGSASGASGVDAVTAVATAALARGWRDVPERGHHERAQHEAEQPAGDEILEVRTAPIGRGSHGLFGEHDLSAGPHQRGQFLRVPVGEPHAAV